MSKTLSIIIGTIVAVVVLTIAAFGIIFYVTADEEDFSRAELRVMSSHPDVG